MSAPAITLGDPRGILQLPPAGMKDPSSWTLTDSDTVAHLIQVHAQIRSSRWYASDIKFTTQGGQLLEGSFPDLEQFVFAAVYFRQLFAEKDQLLREAVERYCKFVDCQIRPFWVKTELAGFEGAIDGSAWPLAGYTMRELFEAYLYGAGLFHGFPGPNSEKRRRFLHLYDKEPPYKVLYALHGSLRTLLNYVGNIAVVIRRDFSHWQSEYSLSLPDVRWHDRLFNLERPRWPEALDV
jgi:hypothetical protein